MSLVIARQGDEVTCTNGHHIADVAKDIMHATAVEPEQFKNWNAAMAAPKYADPINTDCPECGAPWMRGNQWGGWELHLSDGRWHGTDQTEES